MHAHDRYALALAILEGDRDARKVLADLLEEEGDRGLAQWARGGSNQKHRRLEFALMLLPSRMAIGFVLLLAEHAFSEPHDAELFHRFTIPILPWRLEEISDDEIMMHCRQFAASMPAGWGISAFTGRDGGIRNPALKSFILNMISSIEAATLVALAECGQASSGTPRHWENASLQFLRLALRDAQKGPWFSGTADRNMHESVWQLEMTKSLFNQLLSEDSPWPK